jgi:iron complex outermembrane receptor protein
MRIRCQAPLIRQALWTSIAATAGLPAMAQQAPAKPAPQVIDEVVVTGSRISRQGAESASPVQILSRDDLEQTGQQNLAEILRSLSAEGQGTLPTSFTAGFASGASSVSLRGLGVNATLVLVNGRRMAPYGSADDGSRVFTDLNTLPLEAVERIEILKDGASANYGSDAIAGVVNVILRKTVEGGSLITDYGTSYRSDGATARIAGSYGFGNLESERYNVYFTAEGSRQNAINNTDRPGYLGTEDLTSIGWFDNRAGSAGAGRGLFGVDMPNFQTRTPYGTAQVPGGSLFERVNLTPCPEVSQIDGVDADGNPIKSNLCLYDRTQWAQIQPKTERYNLFAKGTYAFNDALEGYVELGFFNARTSYIGTPTSFDDAGPKYCETNAGLVCPAVRITLPAAHPDNPFDVTVPVRYLAEDIGGRNGINRSRVTRAVLGLKGSLSEAWGWEAGVGRIDSQLNTERTGFVLADALQAAINDGRYRINNPSAVSAETYAAISPTLQNEAKNTLTLADATVSGRLLDLPGGQLGVAAGVEWRHEETDSPPTPFTDTGSIIGLGFSKFSSDRKVSAAYVEVDAPVARMLDLSAAFRYDHYSDYGSSSTPKIGFKFTPVEQVALRGTYSEGFRAPGPAEAGNSATFGFTGIGVLSIGNPGLKPEESRSYTLGIVVEPFENTSASIDYYDILRRHEINQADPAIVIGDLPTTGGPIDGQTPGAVPGSTLFYNEFGNLSTVAVPYANGNRTTTNGIDLDLRQRFGLGQLGGVDLAFSWTRVLEYRKLLDDGTSLDYVGTGGPYVLSSATGTPRDRGALTATWSRAGWSVTGRFNYVSSTDLIDHKGQFLVDNGDGTFSTTGGEGTAWFVKDGVDGAPACGVYTPDGLPYHGCRSGSFTTFDLFAKATIGTHLEITGSILNVANRLAPFNPYTYGGLNYNPAWTQAGAIGRYITLGGRYQF